MVVVGTEINAFVQQQKTKVFFYAGRTLEYKKNNVILSHFQV